MSLWVPQEQVKGRDSSGVWDGHVYTAKSKMDNQQDLLYSTNNSAPCYVEAWMGGEFGGERIHVYVWLSPFDIYLKPSQHYLLTAPGLGRYLEKGMAIHFSILAWRNPRTEEPGSYNLWSCKAWDMTEQLTHICNTK